MKKILISIIILSLPTSIPAKTFDIHQVISIGLKNSYDISCQNYNLQTSKQNLYSSYLTILPSVKYSISSIESKNSSIKSGNISLSESISLNDWRYFDIKKGTSALKQREIELQLTRRNFIYNIIQYYIDVLQNKKLLELAAQEVKIAKRNLEETKILLDHGKVSELELQQVEISLSRTLIDSLKAWNNLINSKMELCFAINIEYNNIYDFTEFDYEFFTPEDFMFSEGKILSIAYEKENSKQARRDYNQNKLSFLPTLSFSVNKDLGWEEKSIFDFERSSNPIKYSLSLSYPLLSPITNLPTHKKHKYQLNKAVLQLNNTIKENKKDFNFALMNFKQSKEYFSLSKKQEELEKIHFEIVNERYRLGQSDLTELENARKELFQIKNEKIQSYYNLILFQEQLNLICNNKMLKEY
ncbi:MAG: TolC family protein [Candidatus Cloacimonadota bacterium]|nr:TolC family protein [Candidatus Cloacimonadota bacterium]